MGIRLEAFRPEGDEGTRERELKLFKENTELILENTPKILSCGEYFHCTFSYAFISTIYFGGGYIPLGVLVLGWEEGLLRDECPNCGRKSLWITGFGGGLSLGSKWGVCTLCKNTPSIRCGARGYLEIWKEVVPIIHAFPLYKVIEVEKEVPQFSWSKGIVYKRKKVKERIQFYEPVSLKGLIEDLKSGRNRKCKELIFSFEEKPELKDLFFKKRGW